MPFIPHTPEDVEQMLAAIGAKKIDDLFDEIPKNLRIESLAGIPDALNVQLAYDETGQRLTATLMDYTLATATDAPRSFELRHLESPTPLNPLGAKGAGEGGIMPVHPLIAQAIEDALAPFGARVERVPVTRAEIAAMVRRA